jgi:hypothetical protein
MTAAGTQDDSPRKNLGDDLTDDALESEIELVSELVVAATSSDRPLHQEELDQLLGVIRPKRVDQPKRPEM